MKARRTITSALAGLLAVALANSIAVAEKPNIVLVNMDNFGYGD